MIKFQAVRVEDIPRGWSVIEPLLNRAAKVDHNNYGIKNIKRACELGNYLVWLAYDDEDKENPLGAVTTRVVEHPGGNGLALDWIGGTRMKDWINIGHETIERYAKENNFKFIQGYGRRAWEGHNNFGWKQLYIVYQKDL